MVLPLFCALHQACYFAYQGFPSFLVYVEKIREPGNEANNIRNIYTCLSVFDGNHHLKALHKFKTTLSQVTYWIYSECFIIALASTQSSVLYEGGSSKYLHEACSEKFKATLTF